MAKSLETARHGTKVTVDGWPGTVWRRNTPDLLVSWRIGDPITTSTGRVLGWPTDRAKIEWLRIADPRLALA